jgi:hypothetical protein
MSARVIRFPKGFKPRELPGEATIAQLRTIARESAEHLILADGPVSPDADLLDICGEALHLLKTANLVLEEARATPNEILGAPNGLYAEHYRLICEGRLLMSRARKQKAKTPAGIYAKTLLVRASSHGAEMLAMSLARDLLECAELRASLWPASQPVGGVS